MNIQELQQEIIKLKKEKEDKHPRGPGSGGCF